MKLTFKQKTSFINHLFKVLTRAHHENLLHVLAPYIGKDAVVFDVGGHAGQFTKLFSKMVPDGQVFTFEPSVYSRSILQIMVGLKYLQNVFVLPFGLTNKPVQSEIHTPVKKKGSLGYGLAFVGSADNYQREVVSSHILLSSVDAISDALAIDRVDFIKADIEGSELLLLQGAEKVLEKYHPVILIEINNFALARNGHDGKQVFAYLEKLGYRKVIHVDIDNAVLTAIDNTTDPGDGDYLFVKAR